VNCYLNLKKSAGVTGAVN